MIKQGFHIGNRDWWLMCYYDIATEHDLSEVREALQSSGLKEKKVREALRVLSNYNTGLTFTKFADAFTLVFISKASSAEQMYDTIQHETRHAANHIAEYYGLPLDGEEAAYLQGEIARQMFPAAAMVVCPKCHS